MRSAVFILFLAFTASVSCRRIQDHPAFQPLQSAIDCDFCLAAIELFDFLAQQNATFQEVSSVLIKLCVLAHAEYTDENVCKGAIDEFGPEVIGIIFAGEMNPDKICNHFGYCTSDSKKNLTPKYVLPPRIQKERKASNKTVRMLHISDVHYDEMYLEGAAISCGEPLCCRVKNPNATQVAGKWGNYQCDLPLTTLTQLLDHIASLSPPPDFIIWTGDNTAHDIWAESVPLQLNRLKTVSQLIAQKLGHIPIFPAIGNHDTFPVDQLNLKPADDAHYMNYDFLLSNLTSFWSPFINSAAQQTLSEGGFYSQEAVPGLRVLALNTQWADIYNFYLILNDVDHQDDPQWIWLESQLQSARAAGEKVLLMGHIPPGESPPALYVAWGDMYVNMSTRYADVIIGHFYGHTHNDEFSLVTNLTTGEPTGTVYITSSVTTMTNKNPAYRIYDLDAETFEVLDYQHYIANISLTYNGATPFWYLEYSAKDYFGLPDLSPASWYQLTNDFENDEALFMKWFHIKSTGTPNTGCDAGCKQGSICNMRNSRSGSGSNC